MDVTTFLEKLAEKRIPFSIVHDFGAGPGERKMGWTVIIDGVAVSQRRDTVQEAVAEAVVYVIESWQKSLHE